MEPSAIHDRASAPIDPTVYPEGGAIRFEIGTDDDAASLLTLAGIRMGG